MRGKGGEHGRGRRGRGPGAPQGADSEWQGADRRRVERRGGGEMKRFVLCRRHKEALVEMLRGGTVARATVEELESGGYVADGALTIEGLELASECARVARALREET